MTKKQWKLTREETLSLVCALFVTAMLSGYSLHMKKQESVRITVVFLSEYAESTYVPRDQSAFVHSESRRVKRGNSSITIGSALRTAKESTDEARLTESRLSQTPDSLVPVGRTARDSTSTDWSPVFRPCERSWELDSIMTRPGEPGVALLRQHVIYKSRAYDTARVSHLVRLASSFTSFKREFTLEDEMKRDLQRFGYPYHPLRPQPPSAQVPVLPIIIPVLDFISSAVSGIPTALSRAVKPRNKKTAE